MVRHAVRNRLVLSYFLIGTVLLVLFAAIIMNATYRSARSEAHREVEALLDQNYHTVAQLLEDIIHDVTERFISETPIIMALYDDEFSKEEMHEIHTMLREAAQANRIIGSLYVYNRFTDMVFSSLSSVRTPEESYDGGVRQLLDRGLANPGVHLMPRYVTLRNLSDPDPIKRWISVVLTPKNDASGSAVVVNISQEALQSLIYIEPRDKPGSIESWIIGTDGIVISSENAELFGQYVGRRPHVRRVLESAQAAGSYQTVVDTRRVAVSYRRSATLECVFMTVISQEALLRDARRSLNLILFTTVVFLAAGIVGALFFTRIIYTPLGSLVKAVEGVLPDGLERERRSEYEVVSTVIDFLNLRLSEAQRGIHQYVPERKREGMRRLFRGNTSDASPDYWQHEYGMVLPGPRFAVLIVHLVTPAERPMAVTEYRVVQNHRSATMQRIHSEYSRRSSIEIADVDPDQIAVILNVDLEYALSLVADIGRATGRIMEAGPRGYGGPEYVCLGPLVDSIDDIPSSYRKAADLSGYRFIYPQKVLITPEDDERHALPEYEYPAALERRILEKLRLADGEELPALLRAFSDSVRRFRYPHIIHSLTQLVMMISRSVGSAEESPIQDRWTRYAGERRTGEAHSLDETMDWILRLCAEIIAETRRRASTEHGALAERVRQIVEQHYHESSFCAATVADLVGLSTNYLRTIFKEVTGHSLSDYIAGKRFERAAHLLQTTSQSARDIAGSCGFYNADYFYYAFRRRTGLTPGMYRRRKH